MLQPTCGRSEARSWRSPATPAPTARASTSSASRCNSKQFDQVASKDRLLVGIVQERRVEDEIHADRPVERDVRAIHNLADAHFRDQMAQPLLAEDHGVDEQLPLEILARMFLVRAVRVGPDLTSRFRPPEIRRQIPAGVTGANPESGMTTECPVENQDLRRSRRRVSAVVSRANGSGL